MNPERDFTRRQFVLGGTAAVSALAMTMEG
jgi:hypothetical protein